MAFTPPSTKIDAQQFQMHNQQKDENIKSLENKVKELENTLKQRVTANPRKNADQEVYASINSLVTYLHSNRTV